jgi:hypothetical protein
MRPIMITAALALLLSVAPASADQQLDDDVAKLNAAMHALKTNQPRPGRSEKYGHAISMIKAPLADVRAAVTKYSDYKSLAPDKFSKVNVVAKDGPNTDVYMKIPIMNGMIDIWQVLRFGPPTVVSPGVEVVEGKFVKGGNVKDAHLVFTMRRLDDNFTVLTCDLLMVPSIPAPQSAVDEELRDSALKAVDGLHTKSQGGDNKTYAFTGTISAQPAAK